LLLCGSRALPYEEGTESHDATTAPVVLVGVAEHFPMKRELKVMDPNAFTLMRPV